MIECNSLLELDINRKLSSPSCENCHHWQRMVDEPECSAGFCRQFALMPTMTAWPITEVGDRCDAWVRTASAPAAPKSCGDNRFDRIAYSQQAQDCAPEPPSPSAGQQVCVSFTDFAEPAARQGKFIEARCRTRVGGVTSIEIFDLSKDGCTFDRRAMVLEPDERVLVGLPGLASIAAKIAWIDEDRARITFEQPLYEPVLEQLLQSSASVGPIAPPRC